MKRFSFSRMKQRPLTGKIKEKDLYDPDQRPISISSKAVAKQREKLNGNAPIIKPRVSTTNCISQNYLNFRNSNPNNNDSQFRNSNASDYESINNSNKTGYVSMPLPDIDNNDFDNDFSDDSQNQNFISRFIKTGYKVDRLGTTSTNNNEQTSPIITIDRFGFKSPTEMESNDQIKREFIVQYLLDHTKHENARTIQRAFRLSCNRRHFNRFIRINLQLNSNLKKLTFIVWQMTTSNDPQRLQQLFKKLKEVYKFFCLRFKIRQLAPFRYFYVTHQLFLPNRYSANTLYQFFYLMHWSDLIFILKEWHRVAHLRHKHRKELSRFLFPAKKFDAFGMVSHIFINWHRYSLWQKQSRINKQKKLITLDKWNKHQVNVFWNVKEHNLNSKRTRIQRATEFSINRVASKGVRALFNRSIDSYSQMMINQSADMFRNRHLQTLSHRAWLKYMQKRLQELQIQRDIMRAWYGRSYQNAIKKLKSTLAEKLYFESFRQKILNEWFSVARSKKLMHLKMSLKIHTRPSSMLMIIFALQGDYILSFHILAFRMWIRFTRSRRRFKLFVKFCMQLNTNRQLTNDQNVKPTENQSNNQLAESNSSQSGVNKFDINELNKNLTPIALKERCCIYLNDLIRVARLKLVKRGSVSSMHFFPRSTWMSLEMMIRAIRMISFLDDHISINGKSQIEKLFKETNRPSTWQFFTDSTSSNGPNSSTNQNSLSNIIDDNLVFGSETLTRCFFLILHKHKDYEILKDQTDTEFDGNIEFQQLRSFDELQKQSETNILTMRKHILEKIRRDHAIMSIFVSHIQAEKMKNYKNEFTTDSLDVVNSNTLIQNNSIGVNESNQENLQRIVVYPEYSESIDFLIKENSLAECRLKSTFRKLKKMELSKFSKRLRSPQFFVSQNQNEGLESHNSRLRLDEFDKPGSKESFIQSNPSLLLLGTPRNSNSTLILSPSTSILSNSITSNNSLLSNPIGSNISFDNSVIAGSNSILTNSDMNNAQMISNSPSNKNPLIIQYTKPKQISSESSSNGLTTLINEKAENALNIGFTLIRFKRVLEKFHSQESITAALVSFFMNVCHVYMDVSYTKSLNKPDELLLIQPPETTTQNHINSSQLNLNQITSSQLHLNQINQQSNRNDFNQTTSSQSNFNQINSSQNKMQLIENDKLESDSEKLSESINEAEKLDIPTCLSFDILMQSKKRIMNKNMKRFIADFNGIESDQIPLNLKMPNILSDCISSIFTIFTALKKSPNLSHYLDATPFATLLKSTDPLLTTTQEKTWIAMKEMFPKLEMPKENVTHMALNNMNKKRSLLSSSMFSLPTQQPVSVVSDELTSNEAFLACWLLPYILSFDSIIDFIRDEILAPHNQRK